MSIRRLLMVRWSAALVCLVACGMAVGASATDGLQAADFAWRATLVMPDSAKVARVEVPVQALLHMQSSSAQDLRVFNADGAVVPFAMLGASDLNRHTPVVQTRSYNAYPLVATPPAGKSAKSAVEVSVDRDGQHSRAWVRWDAAPDQALAANTTPEPVQAVLFDTRDEKQALDALDLAAVLPSNALVNLSVASSVDLKDWTSVPVKGPVFRFEGADAPASTTLSLLQPLFLQGRYLRLSWAGQTGVSIAALTGRVTTSQATPAPLRAALPTGTPQGSGSLSWVLPFATPIEAVDVQATRDNTLVPVRILGRNDATQTWRTLTPALVYRLDGIGQGSRNLPTPLHGVSLRGLRLEASQGKALPDGLQLAVVFAPIQVAFLASGAGPYTLAVGRAQTPGAAVDASVLGSVLPVKWIDLPVATVTDVILKPEGGLESRVAAWLPAGLSSRTVLLWLVLVAGVLVLGGVAYSLLRQLGTQRES